MSKYEDMSDLKVECMISAEKWKLRCLSLNQWNNTAKRKYVEIQNGQCVYADARYCNNPSDIMPIAIESKLKIEWLDDDEGDYCNVQSPCGSVFSDNENPYRAMSICFLKMKEAEVK